MVKQSVISQLNLRQSEDKEFVSELKTIHQVSGAQYFLFLLPSSRVIFVFPW